MPTASSMNDRPDSPEERMQRRRARRWKRRARMAGPFLGIPLLLGTLTLSVDLIEYDPQPAQDRLSDRPIPTAVTAADSNPQQRPAPTHSKSSLKTSVSSSSVVSATGSGTDDLLDVTLAGDAALPNTKSFAPPAPPYASGRR